MALHFAAIITLFSLLLFLGTIFAVGHARSKYNIKAPATIGNEDFERVFRVQMNTLENLVLFLPALFNIYVSPFWSGIIGAVWVLGRCYYAVSYIRSAAARSLGYGIGLLAFGVLAVGATVGIAQRIITGI